jgi:hypothetical protein
MTPDEQRRLAVAETDISHMGHELADLKADIRALKVDVAEILRTLAEARGGWRTLLLVGGAAGAAGAMLMKMLPFVGR